MNWTTFLLLLLGLLILARLLFLIRKTSRSKKHTIQLVERPPEGQANSNLPGLILFFFFLLLVAALAVQLILGRLQ